MPHPPTSSTFSPSNHSVSISSPVQASSPIVSPHNISPIIPFGPIFQSPQLTSAPPLRKSERPHNPPSYLSVYVCNAVFFTNLTKSCFIPPVQPTIFPFAALSTSNQQLLNSICNITEPVSFSQDALHPGWRQAMADEFAALEANQT